jgi:hypothetical protein
LLAHSGWVHFYGITMEDRFAHSYSFFQPMRVFYI